MGVKTPILGGVSMGMGRCVLGVRGVVVHVHFCSELPNVFHLFIVNFCLLVSQITTFEIS